MPIAKVPSRPFPMGTPILIPESHTNKAITHESLVDLIVRAAQRGQLGAFCALIAPANLRVRRDVQLAARQAKAALPPLLIRCMDCPLPLTDSEQIVKEGEACPWGLIRRVADSQGIDVALQSAIRGRAQRLVVRILDHADYVAEEVDDVQALRTALEEACDGAAHEILARRPLHDEMLFWMIRYRKWRLIEEHLAPLVGPEYREWTGRGVLHLAAAIAPMRLIQAIAAARDWARSRSLSQLAPADEYIVRRGWRLERHLSELGWSDLVDVASGTDVSAPAFCDLVASRKEADLDRGLLGLFAAMRHARLPAVRAIFHAFAASEVNCQEGVIAQFLSPILQCGSSELIYEAQSLLSKHDWRTEFKRALCDALSSKGWRSALARFPRNVEISEEDAETIFANAFDSPRQDSARSIVACDWLARGASWYRARALLRGEAAFVLEHGWI